MQTFNVLLTKQQVNQSNIYNTFMQETFPEDLEDFHAYININKPRIHRIVCRYLVMTCIEFIEWITAHVDDSHLVLVGFVLYSFHDPILGGWT